jgi:hypothetical protein
MIGASSAASSIGSAKRYAASDHRRIRPAYDAVQPLQPLEPAGLWQRVFAALAACAEPPVTAMVDSTSIPLHRAATGAKATVLSVKRRFGFS